MSQNQDMQALVRKGYEDNCYAEVFRVDQAPNAWEAERLAAFCQGLPAGANLLDLGSGPGVPWDRLLIEQGYAVTGVEFSRQMVTIASGNVPEARYIHADMLQVVLPEAAFDGAMCLYALFHLPRERHAEMLARIASWLAPGGRLLITLGTRAMDCDLEADWCGAPMAWSSHDPATYQRLLAKVGLEVLEQWYEGAPGDPEHHLWVLARRSLARRSSEATC